MPKETKNMIPTDKQDQYLIKHRLQREIIIFITEKRKISTITEA
jgi:hypothetical protein